MLTKTRKDFANTKFAINCQTVVLIMSHTFFSPLLQLKVTVSLCLWKTAGFWAFHQSRLISFVITPRRGRREVLPLLRRNYNVETQDLEGGSGLHTDESAGVSFYTQPPYNHLSIPSRSNQTLLLLWIQLCCCLFVLDSIRIPALPRYRPAFFHPDQRWRRGAGCWQSEPHLVQRDQNPPIPPSPLPWQNPCWAA